jgi:hypothetical protein
LIELYASKPGGRLVLIALLERRWVKQLLLHRVLAEKCLRRDGYHNAVDDSASKISLK